MKPQIEVVKVNMSCHLLGNSKNNVDSIQSDVFQSTISGGTGGGRSRGADWDDDED